MGVAIELMRNPIFRSSFINLFSSKCRGRRCPVGWRDSCSRLGALRIFASGKPEKVLIPRKFGGRFSVSHRDCNNSETYYGHPLSRRKRRLDEVCLERFQQYSRTFIQSWILQGKVLVDGRVVSKAGTLISDKSSVEIRAEVPKYVCRAGFKLEAAIEQLNVDVSGKIALDSGLSTGGFTDCLLQHGASFVYGVDVGYGQVDNKIRNDYRVCVMERTNLRYLPGLPQQVDLVTLDLSFISILLVMPAVINVVKENAMLVALVKPQFEARRSQVGGGGIVRDPKVHQEVLVRITKGVEDFGFHNEGWIESPLKGAEGNTEFLVCFRRTQMKTS